MVATIPTGSACGMAKSMDVLTFIDAALALIHLKSCEMDLLRMRFSSNEDMLNFHKAKLSSSALARAISKYNDYKRRYARELGVHLHNKACRYTLSAKNSDDNNTTHSAPSTSNTTSDNNHKGDEITHANMMCHA